MNLRYWLRFNPAKWLVQRWMSSPVEPPGKTELASHPKVVCTPHIGAETSEAQVRAAIDISTEVIAALDGKQLRWRIV